MGSENQALCLLLAVASSMKGDWEAWCPWCCRCVYWRCRGLSKD